MSFVSIISYTQNNRVGKFQDGFNTLQKAQNHVDAFSGAFAVQDLGGNPLDWLIDPIGKTISVSPRPVAPQTIVSYEEFQDRFSAAEFDSATDYIYETDQTTSKPKRRALIQALARAMASNQVDLESNRTVAFLAALVNGGIITEERKTEILTP